MKEINDYVAQLKTGKAQVYKNMTVIPLIGKSSKLDYYTLDEALKTALNITETGNVQSLTARNRTDKEILMLQGEYVVGGRQNRMIARNIYMAKGYDGQIPVNCVQQHRWHGDDVRFASSTRKATRDVSTAAFSGQQTVWNEVSHLVADFDVNTPTGNIGDVFEKQQTELSDYMTKFSCTPNSVGIATATNIDGKIIFGVEVFDNAGTMQKHFKKIIESYALDAARGNKTEINVTKKDVLEFMGNIKNANFVEMKPISLGRDFRIEGKEANGSALVYEGTPVYVSYGTKKENTNAGYTGIRTTEIYLQPDRRTIRPEYQCGGNPFVNLHGELFKNPLSNEDKKRAFDKLKPQK